MSMVAGVELGLGMWSFGRHCTCHALAARNAHLEAELGRCLDKIRYLEAMRGCEAEERARDRDAMASMRSDLEEAREKIAWQKRRLQYYEHRNNPSSTMSLHNKKLKKFKAGLKAKKSEAAEGGAEEAEKPRQMGPPKGHAGVSHSDKPERIVRIPFKRCAQCSGARVEQRRSCTKPVSDLGPDNKVHTVALVVGEGACLDCGALSKAPTGVLEGTSFGPRLLGAVDEYFHVNCTDAAIARVLERVHGFKTSPNAVLNAREAREPNCLFWIGCIVRARQGWRSGANRQLLESAPGSGIRSSQNRTPRLVGIGTGRRVWPSAEPPWAAPSRGLLPEFAPVPSEAAADTVACHKRCALNPASFSSAAPAIFSASPCRDFGIFKRTLATSFSLVISPRAHLLAAASISWCWYCSPVPYTFGCTRFTHSAAIFSASLRSSAGRWGPILVAIISVAILGFSLSLMMSSTII